MDALARRVANSVVARWAGLAESSTGKKADPANIRPRMRELLTSIPVTADEAVSELEREVFPFNGAIDHPRFFAFVPAPSNFVGAMADMLASGYNVFAGSWLEGSGAAAVELALVDWVRRECGFPETAGGLFVSDGSVANITALIVAREVKLGERLGQGVAYCCKQTHSSVERGLRIIGFRADQIVKIEGDGTGRIPIGALQGAVARDRAAGRIPFCVIANAGTTNTGSIDPLRQVARVAQEEGLWMHVDGAYGVAAVICERGKSLLDGLELADSLSLDPHKWMFQPFECACVLLRDREMLKRTFQVFPDYLADIHRDEEEVNFCDYGIQLTRGFRALKLWLSLRVFGVDAFRGAVERGFQLAELAERELRQIGWEIVSPAQMAIVCFRAPGDDALQSGVVERLLADGTAFITTTVLDGRTVLRMCTINPRTTDGDIRRTITKLQELAQVGN